MKWPLLRVDDLDVEDVNSILVQADCLRLDPGSRPHHDGTLALIFFEPSLRTRVGFTVAAHRLGLSVVEVLEPRASAVSMAESWTDTLRVVAGYADVVVARPGETLRSEEVRRTCDKPFISAGDRGNDAEHPTQALVDLFAMRSLVKKEAPVRVAIWGDPRMRAARSLLSILARTGDGEEVFVVTDETYLDRYNPPEGCRIIVCDPSEVPWVSLDVVYVVGMPHGSLPIERRNRLIISESTMQAMSSDAVVLSPMPVIDEIDHGARRDKRVAVDTQSDLGIFVRMALLDRAFASLGSRG